MVTDAAARAVAGLLTEEADRVGSHKGFGSIDTTIGMQRRLNASGFDSGPNDDIYGPKTKAGVEKFQKFCKENHHGIDERIIDSGPEDGIFGPLTRAALLQYYGF